MNNSSRKAKQLNIKTDYMIYLINRANGKNTILFRDDKKAFNDLNISSPEIPKISY